jgi:hypothetical protein
MPAIIADRGQPGSPGAAMRTVAASGVNYNAIIIPMGILVVVGGVIAVIVAS